MFRFCFTAVFVAFLTVRCFAGQEYTGHYSGPMDVESHSVTRINDGTEGELLTLEDLDQKTVHNVLRQATRPDAVEMVRELTRKQGGEYVLTPEERAAAEAARLERESKIAAERARVTAEAQRSMREAQMAVQSIRTKSASTMTPADAVRAIELPKAPVPASSVRVAPVAVPAAAPVRVSPLQVEPLEIEAVVEAKSGRAAEAVKVGKVVEKEEEVEGTADIVSGMVGLQQSLDALHRNTR